MKKQTNIISSLCLGLLLSIDLSAAGAIFTNKTDGYVAASIKFDNNTERTFLLPPNTSNKADGGVAGVSNIVYLSRGVVRQVGLSILGIEGWREYTLTNRLESRDGTLTNDRNLSISQVNISEVSISEGGMFEKKFTNPLGATEVARTQCDTCPVQKPCPTYTLTGG